MKNDKPIVEKLQEYFPKTGERIKIIRLCEVVGFAVDTIRKLIEGQRLTFKSGSLYSPEHKMKFDAKNTTIAIDTDPKNNSKYCLFANNMNISDWFRSKYKELQQSIGVNNRQKNKTDRKIST